MKVKLLGTGAADGIPAFFADSRVCRHAREHGGKNIRTRAAAIVDDHLKLDLGPDSFHQMVANNLDTKEWSAILLPSPMRAVSWEPWSRGCSARDLPKHRLATSRNTL